MKNTEWNVSPSPFVFAGCQLRISSIAIILSLVPQVFLLGYFNDIQALTVICASLAGAVAAELCFCRPKEGDGFKRFSDGTVLVSGLVTGFLLPVYLNPFLAAVSSFFGIFIARNFFNGKGNSWLSASAFAVVFACISSPSVFQAASVSGLLPVQSDFDSEITWFLNTYLLRPSGINLPGGYVSLFFNPAAPVTALKFGVLTLAASVVLIAYDVVDWIVPVVFIAGYSVLVFLFSSTRVLSSIFFAFPSGDVFFHLFMNGILFVGFYLLSDTSSSPRTKPGRIFSGLIAASAAFLFCGQDIFPSGAVLTVFVLNVFNPAIELIENKILGISPVETLI